MWQSMWGATECALERGGEGGETGRTRREKFYVKF